MTISEIPQEPRPLAIVGMSCRLPGNVASLEDFWELLTNSRDGYKEFPSDRFNWKAFYHPNESRKDSISVNHGYFLDDDVANFDAQFFKMNATDAVSFDPQGRIVLECVYEALENAGIPKESIAGTKVGVFSTSNTSDYTLELKESICSMPAQVGVLGHNCMLSNVVSNVFDLSGPSVSVDTACSSAFYALQMAAQSIRSGETEMCIVSGCALNLSPWRWNMLSNLTMLNPDGRTRALDPETESGYARGEGAGCIILKPLDLALRHSDRVHCVLSHIGVNHNGHTNGYTMPDATMQAKLMEELQANINIRPDDFGFVEAHAPGTRVGDPIEISAIHKVFSSDARTPEEPLLLGSVKANVGHLESASGFPSLIKAALMLNKGQVVPNPNFKDECMNSELRKLNMAVPITTQSWPKGKPYVAINNYGFGGSNAHCIIKMAPESDVLPAQKGTSTDGDAFLFVLCANDEQALARTREQLVEFLELDEAAKVDMRDLAYTLGQRRSQLSWRSALVATELDDLSINTASPRVLQRRVVRPPKIAFAFTGQGAQSFAMGRELLQYPTFAGSLRQSSSCVESFGATFSLQEELYASETTSRINDADVSQAASTAIQIALVDLLRSWGAEPAAVVGHSSGEVAAAYAAGILSLPGAMRIAYARGQMAIRIKTVQPDFKGGMMAVSAGMEDVAPLLDIVTSGTVVVACENSPKSLTVSGEDVALDELETLLEEDGVPHRRLAVDFPYHSPFLEPFVDQYEEDICTTDTFPTATSNNVEFFSAMAGRKIDSTAVKKPSYWASSAKFRVRFTSAMNALLKSKTPPDAVVEIGPNPTLTWATKSILKALGKLAPAAMETLPCLQRGENARVTMLKLAGSLFGLGQRLDLNEVNFGHLKDHGFRPRLVDGLKPYPWTRSRYWIESKVRDDGLLRQFPRHDLLGHAKTHSKDSEMAWSNNFEVEDMPWLRGHQVGSSITFPLAGYICAALEASKQRAMVSSGSDDVITGFTVRDVRMQHNLVFQEGVRVELAIKLRPLNGSDFDEFELSTWSEEQRTWVCHCRALVRCHLAEDAPETGALAKWGEARGKCHSRVGSPLLYQGSAKAGPRRTGAFRNVYNLWYGSGKTTAEVVVSDTEAGMPHHYETASIIHPTTLDGLLQCGSYIPFLDPSNAPIGSTSNIWVPNAVEEVIIGSDVLCKPGLVLQTVARSEQPPQKLRGTYAIDATLENSSNPRVQIRGLRLGVEESLPLQWPEPHYGCYKVEWQPATPLPADATKWHILQGPGDDSGMVGILSHKFGTSAVSISQSLPAEAKFCIVLDVGDGLLGSVDEASFDNIKQALTTCEAVVWVTRGAFHHAKSPTAGMAVGLLRTIRSEMQAPVATLDLDPFTANNVTAQAALVGRIAGHIAVTAKKADPNMEMEFTESSGQLCCSRIIHDGELDCNTHAATDVAPPQDEAFNPDTRGVFGLQRPGLADSLYFQRVDSVPQMTDDEVEIQVAATGIGAEDIEALQGRECSGTVVRCGEKVTRVNVGDKVFGLANSYGAFGTFACARETSLAPLPAAISLEKAASIPATFGAAQLALIEVGRVREGERVVVLAAGSAVGQAAVQVGKAAGAYVYAVVDSPSDREAILAVRPPPDHIVSSLNEVPSVEVVLNPVPGTKNDHTRVSRVLAPLGRFVQIGDLASDSAHRLHTGCSVSGAPLSAVADSLPSEMGIVLDAVADLFARDLCSGISQIQMVSLDHLSETLLTVSPRDLQRKVLVPTKGEIIKTTPARPDLPKLDPEAVYLLVGGGGGLGRVIARWMVDNGARKIGLLSRSTSMSPEVSAFAEDVAASRAEIFLLPCDVTDRQQLQQVVDRCTIEKGFVKGVINAAMVFKGGVFSSVSHKDFNAVIQPKVNGTWNLHHTLSNAPLDFFVLISSVAGVIGTPGHSSYAAANTFLDSFAKFRMQQGLPATALALTAVVDAGYMAENAEKLQKLKYVDEYEGEILTTQDVLALLSAAVSGVTGSSCDGFSITGAGFGAARKLPAYARDPRFSALVTRHAKEQEANPKSTAFSSDNSLLHVLDHADDEAEATRALLNAVRNKVAELQLMPVSDILDGQTIVDLGLDSLTAMELYSWIGRVFRMKFRVQEYAKLDTLEKIVDSVMSKRETADAAA